LVAAEYAHVDRPGVGSADSHHLPLLDNPQEVHLQVEPQLADFVQKEGSAVGRLKHSQTAALVELVRFLVATAAKAERLVVHGRELRHRDPNYRPRHVVARELTDALRQVCPGSNLLSLVHEFQKSRDFHDRTIDIALIDQDGCEVEYRYDLTGGIDFLLDPAKATKLFCYRVES